MRLSFFLPAGEPFGTPSCLHRCQTKLAKERILASTVA